MHEVKKVMLKLQRGETKWSQTELNVYDSYQEHQQQATVLIFISLKFNSDRFLKFNSNQKFENHETESLALICTNLIY